MEYKSFIVYFFKMIATFFFQIEYRLILFPFLDNESLGDSFIWGENATDTWLCFKSLHNTNRNGP